MQFKEGLGQGSGRAGVGGEILIAAVHHKILSPFLDWTCPPTLVRLMLPQEAA